jgi:DNA-directed RNA polymerase specialized sigma24 family protein
MAQDVFVRVWERLAQFRGESAFTSWLHRLTVNFVLDEHRTEGRRVARVVAVEGLERIEQGVAVAAGEVAAVRVPTRTQGGYRIPREVAATEVDASLRALAQRGG